MAAFRAALVEHLIVALPETVQVEYGLPAPEAMRRTAVYLGPAVENDVSLATIKEGRRTRDESYRVIVRLVVAHERTGALSEAAAVALLGHVEDVLADDHTLGVDGVLWASISQTSMDTWWGGDGLLVTVIDARINARGRLR